MPSRTLRKPRRIINLDRVTGGLRLRDIFGGGSSRSIGDSIDRKIDSHMPLSNLSHPGM